LHQAAFVVGVDGLVVDNTLLLGALTAELMLVMDRKTRQSLPVLVAAPMLAVITLIESQQLGIVTD